MIHKRVINRAVTVPTVIPASPGAPTKLTGIAGRRQLLRLKLWPEVTEQKLWNRKQRSGFTTIPRLMSFFMEIIDTATGSKKGKPASRVYLELWCRVFDENFVTIKSDAAFAYACGFRGERGRQTLADRLDTLQLLGFIGIQSGDYGKRCHVLLLDPYMAVQKLIDEARIPDQQLRNSYEGRKLEANAD